MKNFFKKRKKKSLLLEKKNEIALKITNLTFSYNPDKPNVLKKINLEIPANKYVAIIGHNGSGKSTLMKLITGVLQLNEGEIQIFGHSVNPISINRIRQFLGIVFQNPDNQFIGSTVKDDVAFGLECRMVPQSEMEAIIVSVLKKVNMEKFEDHEPLMLSGGQKQKVAIASTIALSPEIIIFDEATSMLDPRGKTDIKRIMRELRDAKHKTIFSITHDMDEIIQADFVVVMNDGEVVKTGTPHEILKNTGFLKSIKLDVPFIYQVIEALQKEGIAVEHTLDEDHLIKQLVAIKNQKASQPRKQITS